MTHRACMAPCEFLHHHLQQAPAASFGPQPPCRRSQQTRHLYLLQCGSSYRGNAGLTSDLSSYFSPSYTASAPSTLSSLLDTYTSAAPAADPETQCGLHRTLALHCSANPQHDRAAVSSQQSE